MGEQQNDAGSSDADGVTRRRLMRMALLAAGAGAVAIPAGTLGGQNLAKAADLVSTGRTVPSLATGGFPAIVPSSAPTLEPHPSLSPAESASSTPSHSSTPARPQQVTWLSTWSQPVYQLDEFLARAKGTTMPRNAIMLTIDDGPHPEWTPKYLRLLERYHVHATFCMIGEQVPANRSLVKAVASEGHHIGNHTFHHPLSLPKLPAAKIKQEMEDTTDAIVSASGFRPRQFRAPGGNWGPEVFAEAARQEMLPLGWDIDPRDWARPGVAHIRDAMLAARPHDIVLCHDGGGDRSQTYAALETVIPAILARGWTFVTLPAPQTL